MGELLVIGKHCSVPQCNQLDFLPFTCDVCKCIFCGEHHRYENHDCARASIKDKRAVVCPMCSTPLAILPYQDPNIVLDDHITGGCTKQGPPSYACNARGCKTRELVPFICKRCGVHYCVRHRFEQDHKCPGKRISKQPTKQPTAAKIPSNLPSIPSIVNLGIRLTDGSVVRQNFSSMSRLREVQQFIDHSRTDGTHPYIMHTVINKYRYPKKEYSFEDLDKTLDQLKLCPSGMIMLQNIAGLDNPTQPSGTATSHAPPAEGQQGSWWDSIKGFIYSFNPL